tara:strand:+ start:1286 stop:1660 length:375 start_codon:yes stop_codon:yes gene_type:complete
METIITVVLTLLGAGIVFGIMYAVVALGRKMNGTVDEIHRRVDDETRNIEQAQNKVVEDLYKQVDDVTTTMHNRLDTLEHDLESQFNNINSSMEELNGKIDSRYDKLYNTFFKVVDLDNNSKNK